MAHPSLLLPRGDEIRLPPRLAPATRASGPGPVVLVPRRIPGGVAATLDALPDGALPRLAYAGPAAGLRRALRAALAERMPRPRWLANWLLDDVLDHAALLADVAELAGARSLHVSLGQGLGQGLGASDGSLAAAPSRLRLVAVYRGPGVDWLPPRAAATLPAPLPAPLPDGEEIPAGLLRRLDRGDAAILRGDGDAGGPGVFHRAAPPAGSRTGAPLLLAIDAPAPPAPAVQPPNSRASTASQSRST